MPFCKTIFLSFVCFSIIIPVFSQSLIHQSLTDRFYSLNEQKIFWFTSTLSFEMRKQLLDLVDNAAFSGLDKTKYSYTAIQEKITVDSNCKDLKEIDKIFTDIAIAYCKDLYQGTNINNDLLYDELSPEKAEEDNNYILSGLLKIRSGTDLKNFTTSLEPEDKDYLLLKTALQKRLLLKDTTNKITKLRASINFYRWMRHFRFNKFIVVNIASAKLRYYENNNEMLQMKVIVGKPSTRTPRFAARNNQLILYPYWNVPRSIAIKELLPKFKRSPSSLYDMNMQVVNANGTMIDPNTINWSRYSSKYFPYSFRQCTGCDNSLGVIKFDLTDPFSVYMHDTNTKGLFKSNNPYRSHGCIRLEKPAELANYLLDNKIDTSFIKACFKDQKPVILPIKNPVPVFVVYLPVETDSANNIVYQRDIYRLFK